MQRIRSLSGVALTVLALLAFAAPSHAGPKLEALQGHLSAGFSKLFIRENPAGSISLGVGVDYPLSPDWRLGLDVNEHLLGGITSRSGSLYANVDYSVFETAVLLHWRTNRLGPIHRVSFGPAVMSARAEISSSAGGFAFDSLSVGEIAPGMAAQVTLISAKVRPVAVGFEVGAHTAFLKKDPWTLLSARLTFHY
jgi:hypothetical protein